MKHNLPTTLFYYNEEGDASPYAHTGKPCSAVIKDITGDEAKYTLDDYGFQLVNQSSKVTEWLNSAAVEKEYYPELEKLLKEVTGCKRVVVFNHITRLSQTLDHKKAPDSQLAARPTVKWVHLDRFSAEDAAKELIIKHTGSDAESLLKGRYQVMNIWRPIKTILKDPFGIASAVPESDLVYMPYTTPEETGVKFGVKYRPYHQWYYKYKQEPNEVLLFKAFDTETSCKETRVPHTAFSDADEEDKAPRESIEARALLFY
ncbi:hypothetical protein BLS_002179 [Venturia inaequalis]|uniref:Uncharacterized protein n=1 Tax=Venturia inaequalis TaxID=5025 RepID=A0A8H3US58_VENIN|nr:hypothetical protein BLS_002179 [Venturia inaequalis]